MTNSSDPSPDVPPSRAGKGVFSDGMRLVARSWRLRPFGHALSTLAASTYGVASVVLTIVMGRVTDDVITPGFADDGLPRRTLLLGVLAFMIVGLARSTGAMGRRWFMSWAEYGTQRVWRKQLLDRYLDVPMEYHQRVPAGRLLAHADADVEAATRMLKPLAFASGTMIMAIVAMIVLFVTNVWLALVGVVLFPTLAILNRSFTSRVAQLAIEERAIVGEVSSIAHESFDGALIVKTLGREQAEVQRIDAESARLEAMRVRIGRIRATFEPLLDSLPNIGIVVLILLGSWLVNEGNITIGELVRAMAMFTILAVPVRIVGFFLQELPSSVAALSRVDGVIAEPIEGRAGRTGQIPAGPLSIALDDVSFAYTDVPVLDRISAQFAAGESVAIVGSTGAGKSTIGALLTQLADPESGTVLLGDVPINSLDPEAVADSVGIVFQEAFLFTDTIRENVTLGRDFSEHEIRAALSMAHADFVSDLEDGIDTVVGERGVTLSGGQRQRVALARALIRRPRVLVLDDATSAVDPTIEAGILGGLRTRLDTTLVVIAYRLATIRLADRVLYLSGGRVVGDGTHQELMGNDNYAALIRAYEEASEAVTN